MQFTSGNRESREASPSWEAVTCPLCGASDSDVIFRTNDLFLGGTEIFTMVRCSRCTLAYLNPRPGLERLGDFYPDDYDKYSSLAQALWVRWADSLYNRWYVRRLVDSFPRGASVLDVGCGDGVLLGAFKRAGFAATGVEPKQKACDIIERLHKIPVHCGELKDAAFSTSSFDLVTLIHVLEHLPDPRGTLQEVHRILKPGGRLIVEVPNHDCLEYGIFGRYAYGWHIPRHLLHFNPKTLREMLTSGGFEPGEITYSGSPTSWVGSLLQLLTDKLTPGRPLGKPLTTLRPFLKLAIAPFSFFWTHGLKRPGGVMEVIAARRD